MPVRIDLRLAMDYNQERIRTVKDVKYKTGTAECYLKYEKGTVDSFGTTVDGCTVDPGDVIINLETGERLTADMTGEEKYKRIKDWLAGDAEIPIEVEDIIL